MHFESKYASSYGVIVSSVKAVARIPWNDPAWKDLYIDDTGWTIPHDGDPISSKYDGGQCTWFAQTVWPDEVPGATPGSGTTDARQQASKPILSGAQKKRGQVT